MDFRRRLFESFYRNAASPEDLVWHKHESPALLVRLASARAPGRALDLGCGEGVNAAFLADAGWSVTGVDFVPEALRMAAARADAVGVDVEFVESDVLAYTPDQPFDLVVDSGCLHHIGGSGRSMYVEKLHEWLAPDGDYLLVHFVLRSVGDWRPGGPRRVRHDTILRTFDRLHLEAHDEMFYDLPFPLGPRAVAGIYWFRPPAFRGP